MIDTTTHDPGWPLRGDVRRSGATDDDGMVMDDRTRADPAMAQPPLGAAPGAPMPRNETPIVPRTSIGGTALVAVVAIMTFLASLTAGAVSLVRSAADDWQADLTRELTIQVRPMQNRDFDTDVAAAVAIAKRQPGVADVRAFSRDESMKLLEPFLGAAADLADLPVPRLVVVRLAPGAAVDSAAIRRQLQEIVPAATLDDHRGFVGRMQTMAGSALLGGLGILVLVVAATVLCVTFATRGAMATNRAVIEVLHLIGARDSYIAGHFQRHFLTLGLKGGLIGGGAAIVLFVIARLAADLFQTSAGAAQATALFGTFAIGVWGYVAVALQIVLIAGVTALTSRYTVTQTLDAMG